MDRGATSHLGGAPTVSTAPRSNPFTPPNLDGASASTSQPQGSAQSPGGTVSSPIRRKPLPSTASKHPLTPTLSTGGLLVAIGDDSDEEVESPSQDNRQTSDQHQRESTISQVSQPLQIRDLDRFPRGHSPLIPQGFQSTNKLQPSNLQRTAVQNADKNNPRSSSPTRPKHVRLTSDPVAPNFPTMPKSKYNGLQRSATTSLYPSKPTKITVNSSSEYEDIQDPSVITKTPRSPGPNKLTSFFGWKTASPNTEGSHYPDPGRSQSPSPTHVTAHPQSSQAPMASTFASKTNHTTDNTSNGDNGFFLPLQNPDMESQVNELEEELKEVSLELAGSIRRELELEDMVDRLQFESGVVPDLGRRTSDYFSDSGASSIKYPLSEPGGAKAEDSAKQKRSSEQDQAKFRLDLSQKLQDERGRRRVLEAHIQRLGAQVQNIDEERTASSDAANRIRELESALEDHRRKLKEERTTKENFEDLLTALRGEIESTSNERDNLKDEVVPRLQVRVEGLETEAAEVQKLQYDKSAMQQELQSLRNENTTLVNARRLQLDLQSGKQSIGPIAEEEVFSPITPTAPKAGLTRSNSVATIGKGLTRTGSLSRSNSVSTKERELKDNLADRVKDIEMQRDSLHGALKSLLDRQAFQTREHAKKVKQLEIERDRAIQNQSPRRSGFEKEVKGLRYEINQLRKRADEAMMQKWQCEKGLGGIKMDLDRAEQETASLRDLLHEHDILVPELSNLSAHESDMNPASSKSLQEAYKELQAKQTASINKLRQLWGDAPSPADDERAAKTMDALLESMSRAEAERDFAQKQADMLKATVESLQEAERFHQGENEDLAQELSASAHRAQHLASQIRTRLEQNNLLRQRLAEAVRRGEQEQQSSAAMITGMQSKLKTLEDKLMSAQQHSEEAFAKHEEEVKQIEEAQNFQLRRTKTGGGGGGGMRTPNNNNNTSRSPNPNNGSSPMLSPIFGARSPKLDQTTSGKGMSMNEALRTQMLERKVKDLEEALGGADKEMEEVVSRMNKAQIEVMELQGDRDEAMRQTRKLQLAINDERDKVDSLMKS